MFREAAEAARAVDTQLQDSAAVRRLAERLRSQPVDAVVTLARGSSDHACTYARYLIETRLALLTSSAAPSVSSLYSAAARQRNTLLLAISQSGSSPDLLAAASAARDSGALVVALVNVEDSPLAALADEVIPLGAGRETSVAATKSFIAALAAVLHLVARWMGDDELLDALSRLPGQLSESWRLDWSPAIAPLIPAGSLFVVGRGLGLGIAQEAALKLKETCRLHAEAVSAAELRHGPIAIVDRNFPVLVFAQQDPTLAGTRQLVSDLVSRQARVLCVGTEAPGATVLPARRADPAIEPVLQIQSFYRMVNALAVARGHDPDRPVNLAKVTETL